MVTHQPASQPASIHCRDWPVFGPPPSARSRPAGRPEVAILRRALYFVCSSLWSLDKIGRRATLLVRGREDKQSPLLLPRVIITITIILVSIAVIIGLQCARELVVPLSVLSLSFPLSLSPRNRHELHYRARRAILHLQTMDCLRCGATLEGRPYAASGLALLGPIFKSSSSAPASPTFGQSQSIDYTPIWQPFVAANFRP